MVKNKRYCFVVIFAFIILAILGWPDLYAAEGPLFYLIPVRNSIFIVLGDTPRSVYGFKVWRKNPGSKEFRLLTQDGVFPVRDPYEARQIIGSDYQWVARKVGTDDPVLLWQRLRGDRNLALLLCLISYNLRVALGRTYIDKNNIIPGIRYTYRIDFINSIGKIETSKIKSVMAGEPPKPPSPLKIEAKPGDGKISLSWKFPSYSGKESDLTVGFNIYRKEKRSRFKKLTPAPVFRVENGLFYLDESVENGVDYIYGISAVNIIGVESDTISSSVVTPFDSTPPIVPMGLTAVDREEGVLLIWRISAEPDFDYYEVLKSSSLRGKYEVIETGKLKNPRFLDRDVVRGKPVYYKVIVVDGSGNRSKPSGAVTIIPKDITPPGPVFDIEVSVDPDERYSTITWEPPPDTDIRGYYIYRGMKEEKLIRITDKPYESEKNPTTFIDRGYKKRGLYPGKHVYYGVSACDFSYNEGDITIVEVLVPDKVPPHPAYSLSAGVTDEGWVFLVWQPSLSSDLASHRIYRKLKDHKEISLVATLERNVTKYTDKTSLKGKPVIYFLTEVDEQGNESEPTREVEVVPTDIFPPGAPVNLHIQPFGRKIKLAWQKPLDDDVVGCNVWVKRGASRWVKLNKKLIVGLEYTVSRPVMDGLYGVSCVDSSGNEGKKAIVIYSGLE